ncbi:hydroxyisourate hydrolase [Paenibacillus barcinonensis]|uniref:5-hydroxyisourate hydrolase n=1 Tax=Paenibacillus barcinonensis TaxID=198119 RepID=A0A2V4WN21_PAEBA|nr:hydroxyisourate hydrolase [Paenibacillus barcinonensis]PYE49142.1 5-hydroxyisourate hydrolase [Paenibacillus barcinonensis]QKS55380.1 hydroxyisourate hydrolase [Paenibacillus barcinonensis]
MEHHNGRITTHVLDTSRGVPAVGIRIELFFIERAGAEAGKIKVAEMLTNSDGRLDQPMLGDGKLQTGEYELHFHVHSYFTRGNENELPACLWTVVPIRFAVSDATSHYHIPLLIAPGGYSTYRGS